MIIHRARSFWQSHCRLGRRVRRYLLNQPLELKLAIQGLQRRQIRLRLADLGQRRRQFDIGLDGGQLIGETHHRLLLAELLGEGLAAAKRQAGHGIQIAGDRLNAANPLQQGHRRLGPHPGHARNVVAGVAHQRQVVDDELRRHTKALDDALSIRHLPLHGVDQGDVGRDQLRHVLVPGTDQDLDLLLGRLAGQSADHVIRLDPLDHQQRQAHGSDDGMDRSNLAA